MIDQRCPDPKCINPDDNLSTLSGSGWKRRGGRALRKGSDPPFILYSGSFSLFKDEHEKRRAREIRIDLKRPAQKSREGKLGGHPGVGGRKHRGGAKEKKKVEGQRTATAYPLFRGGGLTKDKGGEKDTSR